MKVGILYASFAQVQTIRYDQLTSELIPTDIIGKNCLWITKMTKLVQSVASLGLSIGADYMIAFYKTLIDVWNAEKSLENKL